MLDGQCALILQGQHKRSSNKYSSLGMPEQSFNLPFPVAIGLVSECGLGGPPILSVCLFSVQYSVLCLKERQEECMQLS